MRFDNFMMTHIVQSLKSTLQFDVDLLSESRSLANVAKFCQIAADAVLQGKSKRNSLSSRAHSEHVYIVFLGRFVNGAEQTYDLLASILENLHASDFFGRSGPSSQTVTALYKAFNRMILLKLFDLEQNDLATEQTTAFLTYCIHHQKIILSARNTDLDFLRCFCYHLYQFLLSDNDAVKNDAASVSEFLLFGVMADLYYNRCGSSYCCKSRMQCRVSSKCASRVSNVMTCLMASSKCWRW